MKRVLLFLALFCSAADAQVITVGGLQKVVHDTSLTGTGTNPSPLGVSLNGGVNQSCSAGSIVTAISSAGIVTCTPLSTAGAITSVVAGNGIAVSTTSGAATVSVNNGTGLIFSTGALTYDSTVIQSRVSGTCTAPQSILAIAANGTVTCTTGTSTLTNSAGNNVLPKSNGTNLVASSATDDGSTFALGSNFSVNDSTGNTGVGLAVGSSLASAKLNVTTTVNTEHGILVTENFTGGTTAAIAGVRVVNSSTLDTTAGALNTAGVYTLVTASRSAGANTLTNIGNFVDVTGAQTNIAIRTDNGSNYFNSVTGNTGIGIASGSALTAKLNVQSTGNASTFGTTPAGATNARTATDTTVNGTLDTTAGALTAIAANHTASSTRSAGANNLTNIASQFTASGAQVNIGIQTIDGSNYLNTTSGNTGVGFASGAALSAKFNVSGTAAISSTLTADGGLRVFDAVGTGLARDGTNANQVDLAINGGTTQTCGAGTVVTAVTGLGITTCSSVSSVGAASGTGTLNALTKWSNTSGGLQDSSLFDDGTTLSSSDANTKVGLDTGTGAKLFNVGRDVNLATNAQNGVAILAYTDGNNYIDSKTWSGGSTKFRVGQGASAGITTTWLTVTNNGGAATFGSTITTASTISGGKLNGTGASGQFTISGSFISTAQTANSIGAGNFSNTGTFDTTAAALTEYGIKASNTATRSAGANNLTNIGGWFSASGAQVNQGLVEDQGDVVLNNSSGTTTIKGNTTIGVTSGQDHTLNGRVTGSTSGLADGWAETNTLSGATYDAFGVEAYTTGTQDSTAAQRTNYAIFARSNATRSAGANNVNNIAGYFDSSGAQVDRAIQTDNGDVLLNNVSGTTTIGGNTTIAGSATLTTTNGLTTIGAGGINTTAGAALIGEYEGNFGTATNGSGTLTDVSWDRTKRGMMWTTGAAILDGMGFSVGTPAGGQHFMLCDLGSASLTIKHENTGETTPGRRFHNPNAQDLGITNGQCVDFVYDSGATRWYPTSAPVSGIGGTTNWIPKYSGANGFAQSSISDSGTVVATTEGMQFCTACTNSSSITSTNTAIEPGSTAGTLGLGNGVAMTGGITIGAVGNPTTIAGQLTANYTNTAQTVGRDEITVTNSGTFNTSAAALTGGGINVSVTATDATGPNTLTDRAGYFSATGTANVANVAMELNASGGATSNTALLVDGGNILFNGTGTLTSTQTLSKFVKASAGAAGATSNVILRVENSGSAYINIAGASGQEKAITFTETAVEDDGKIAYDSIGTQDHSFHFYVNNGTAAMSISSTGVSMGTLSAGTGTNQFAGDVLVNGTGGLTVANGDTTLKGNNFILGSSAAAGPVVHMTIKDNSNRPTVANCGTTPSVTGSDSGGYFTTTATPTASCALTFHTAFGVAVDCDVWAQTGTAQTAIAYSAGTTGITGITAAGTNGAALASGVRVHWQCFDH